MNEKRVVPLRRKDEIDDPLTEILRSGARRPIAGLEFDATHKGFLSTWFFTK
jgi:hypothetical protein